MFELSLIIRVYHKLDSKPQSLINKEGAIQTFTEKAEEMILTEFPGSFGISS